MFCTTRRKSTSSTSSPGYDSTTKRFVYGEGGQRINEISYFKSTQTSAVEYVYLDDLPIAYVGYQGPGSAGVVRYLETDHLGTPRKGVDPAMNATLWKWDLLDSAFGENAEDSGISARFPGQFRDGSLAFYYNYFRDYEAGTGRYIESDPIGLYGGLDTYAYAESDPLLFSDRDGRTIYPALYCQAFPRLCKDLEDCIQHPETCRGKFCRAGHAIYHSFCDKSACSLGDACPILALKMTWATSCLANRLLAKQVCFGGSSDGGHAQEIDIARAKVRGCDQLLQKCSNCFQ